MNWELKQAQILETTKRSLNAERQCVFPPVGDTITFLDENETEELESIGQFTNDWTISFDSRENRDQYVLEIIATRIGELPEAFGQNSFFEAGGNVFQVSEFFRSQSHKDLQQPFVTAALRPTIKIYCFITQLNFPG